MNILVYDVETANPSNIGSICAVGWVLLRDGVEAESGYSLINPHCSFSDICSAIHGITNKDVQDAPSFKDYWNLVLSEKMYHSLVIAHNAGFDMAATEQALFNYGIPDLGIDYIDSLAVLRSLMDADSYKLADLANAAGYTYHQHNALEDAKALAFVLKYVSTSLGFSEISELFLRSHIASATTLNNHYEPKGIWNKVDSHPLQVAPLPHLPSGSVSGLRFCITGGIPGYDRYEIEKMIEECGGKTTSAVSGKTDYLLVGSYESYEGFPADYVSGKTKKALEIIEEGGKIKIIHFDDLLALLNGNPNHIDNQEEK